MTHPDVAEIMRLIDAFVGNAHDPNTLDALESRIRKLVEERDAEGKHREYLAGELAKVIGRAECAEAELAKSVEERDNEIARSRTLVNAAVAATERAERAEAEAAALRKDAERYRWLRHEHDRIDVLGRVCWKVNNNRDGSGWCELADSTALDAAIDAALAAKGEKG